MGVEDRDSDRGGQNLLHRASTLAAKQFGVVSLAQLLAIGLTYKEIRGLVTRGHLHPLHRAVFALGHRNIGPWGHLMAAFLACGPDSFLSHRTAAAARGLRNINTRRIEVTVVNGCKRPGLTIHRILRPPDPKDITIISAIRFSSLPRMLVELSPTESPAELDRLITFSARKQILDVDAVEDAIGRYAGYRGIAKLKSVFHAYRPKPDRKSELEREFDDEIEGTDIPEPVRNETFDGWELDCYWPAYGVTVELDGRPYHVAVRDMEKDKYKDGKLLLRGIETLRITDFRWRYDRAGAIEDLRILLRLRAPPTLQPPPAGS